MAIPKKQVSIGVTVAAVVACIALVAFLGFRAFSGPNFTPVPTSKEMHTQAEKLALKSGGDFSKLSPEEQKMLDGMTMGRGKRYVELHFKRLSSSGGK